MSKHIDLMEPIFFTPPNQPTHPVGGRKLFKGGGGGSGQRAATAEEKRLWAAQAQSLEGMNAVAMPNLVAGMNNLGELANESMDGTLATRLRGLAGADASAAMGQGLTGATQKMERFGATMNPNALNAQLASTGLAGAAMKSNAMNQANVAAEDAKWNRNAALTGLASGQGAQAINGMGSLAGQISQNRMSANSMDMQAQQNQGQAVAGLMIGGKMMGFYKDGGRVNKRKEPRFAGGGMAHFTPVSMPKIAPFRFNADDKAPAADGGAMQTVAGAVIPAMGTRMMASGLDKIGISAPKLAIDGMTTAAKDVVSSFGTDAAFTPIAAEKAAEAAVATDTASATGAAADAWAAGELAADAALATEATTAGAMSGLGGAAMAAAPWLIGGYALGSVLDLWADGGKVRKDMTKGGEVSGPGTGTSDSVPARLSDGEGVVNTRAMGMSKAETQKVVEDWQKNGGGADDLVLAINDRGLEKRHGKAKAQTNPRYEGGNQKMALGGVAQALGQGLYTAAPMMNQMDQQKKADERWERQDARIQRMHDRQIGAMDKEAEEDRQVKAMLGEYAQGFNAFGQQVSAYKEGKIAPGQLIDQNIDNYNKNAPDGKFAFKLQDGSYVLANNASGKDAQPIADKDLAELMASPQTARAAQQGLLMELAKISPKKYFPMVNGALESAYQRQEKLGDVKDERNFQTGRDDKRYKFEEGQTNKKLAHDLGMTRMKIGAENQRHADTMALGMAKINADGGMGGRKVMDGLAKYDRWLKSALEMGETQTTEYDDTQRARVQSIYSNGMKLAQRQLEQGKMPDVDSLIRQATDLADGVGFSAVDITDARKGANTGNPGAAHKPTANAHGMARVADVGIAAADIGYDPNNRIQYDHVMRNLGDKSMRAQALAWVEGNMLGAAKKIEVKRALGLR